jgi:hypothetical protein
VAREYVYHLILLLSDKAKFAVSRKKTCCIRT